MTENIFYHHSDYLNVANYFVGTTALGPGIRSALWLQGCPFTCKGCYSKEWTEAKVATLAPISSMADLLLSRPDITGITISGGEPMVQAEAVLNLLVLLKQKQPSLNILLFTGFQGDYLLSLPETDPRRKLMLSVDAMIDGLYVEGLNNNRGLRGSTNQRIWDLSGKMPIHEFEDGVRRSELFVRYGSLTFIGIPDTHLARLVKNQAWKDIRNVGT